jgi:hypothetical protein
MEIIYLSGPTTKGTKATRAGAKKRTKVAGAKKVRPGGKKRKGARK